MSDPKQTLLRKLRFSLCDLEQRDIAETAASTASKVLHSASSAEAKSLLHVLLQHLPDVNALAVAWRCKLATQFVQTRPSWTASCLAGAAKQVCVPRP